MIWNDSDFLYKGFIQEVDDIRAPGEGGGGSTGGGGNKTMALIETVTLTEAVTEIKVNVPDEYTELFVFAQGLIENSGWAFFDVGGTSKLVQGPSWFFNNNKRQVACIIKRNVSGVLAISPAGTFNAQGDSYGQNAYLSYSPAVLDKFGFINLYGNTFMPNFTMSVWGC